MKGRHLFEEGDRLKQGQGLWEVLLMGERATRPPSALRAGSGEHMVECELSLEKLHDSPGFDPEINRHLRVPWHLWYHSDSNRGSRGDMSPLHESPWTFATDT